MSARYYCMTCDLTWLMEWEGDDEECPYCGSGYVEIDEVTA